MSFVRNLCLLVSFAFALTPLLAQDTSVKSDACVIKMVLGTEDGEETVTLWASDGTKYAYVSALVHAIENGSIEEHLTLHIEPTNAPIDPTKVTQEQQINIRITGDAAELFVSEKMPFHILESVNSGLKESLGLQQIVLRTSKKKAVANDSDPFGSGNSTSKSNANSDASKVRGSVAPDKAPASKPDDDPFGS